MGTYKSLTLQRLESSSLVKQLMKRLEELLKKDFELHGAVMQAVTRIPSIGIVAVLEYGYGQNHAETRLLVRIKDDTDQASVMVRGLIVKELKQYEIYFVEGDQKLTDAKGNELEDIDGVSVKDIIDEAIFIYSGWLPNT